MFQLIFTQIDLLIFAKSTMFSFAHQSLIRLKKEQRWDTEGSISYAKPMAQILAHGWHADRVLHLIEPYQVDEEPIIRFNPYTIMTQGGAVERCTAGSFRDEEHF